MLKGNLASQLRGKNFSQILYPFSFKEFISHYTKNLDPQTSSVQDQLRNLFDRYLSQGGFPGLLNLDQSLHIELLQSYWDTMLIKDIIEGHPKDKINITTFIAFSQAMIDRVACPMTINKIKNNFKELGLKFSSVALYKFLQYLEEAFVVFSVPIFSKSEAIRNRNPLKIYCIDWHLAQAVIPGGDLDVTRKFENMVFIELRRRGYELFYYKTRRGYEIDFIAVSKINKTKILVQVAYSLNTPEVRERNTRCNGNLSLFKY